VKYLSLTTMDILHDTCGFVNTFLEFFLNIFL